MRVIFSPHCDDAYLSLGGSIQKWGLEKERIVILNCFSRSGFSLKISSKKPAVVDLITHTRQLEESFNALKVGAEVEFMNLPEAPLRGYSRPWTFPIKKRTLRNAFGKAIDDVPITQSLEKIVRKYASTDVDSYFPLALGKHVDHTILNEIAEKVTKESRNPQRIFYYEDMPYGARPGIDLSFLSEKGFEPILNEINWEEKATLLLTYESQLSGKYGKKIIDSVETYCRSLNGHERLWKASSESDP